MSPAGRFPMACSADWLSSHSPLFFGGTIPPLFVKAHTAASATDISRGKKDYSGIFEGRLQFIERRRPGICDATLDVLDADFGHS
jgi:hypothetical protein